MTTVKPSERIEQIRNEIIDKEYISCAFANYGLDRWRETRKADPKLLIDAMLAYMDEVHESQERK